MLYGLDSTYLTSKKQVLDRALAIIACIRCGEISGGVTRIRMPDKLLAALGDPSRKFTLRGHSSSSRQYAPLIRMGVVAPVKQGELWGVQLINTPDNLEALQLARSLLMRKGDAEPERGNEQEAARLLFTGGDYLTPIEGIAMSRHKTIRSSDREIRGLWEEFLQGGL